MKITINTKYSIGDRFWIMESCVPRQIEVRLIKIQISSLDIINQYACSIVGYSTISHNFYEHELNALCKTKEELRRKIFGE